MRMDFKRIVGTTAIALVVASGAFIAYRSQAVKGIQPTVADGQHVPPVLIPGIQEPAEMRVEPITVAVLTPPERMLGEAMQQVGNRGGPAALLPALDRIITKYPDYSDGYVMRLGGFCDGSDRAAILSNVNNALKYVGNSRTGKDSLTSLLSMRAKVEHANGDDSAAMGDLDKAIHSNIADATQFVNSGAVAPEKTASACTWTQPDMDALVQRFPDDYRAYVLRGLYYGFFAQWNQDSLKPALENLRKAGEMNTTSALPHFFSAHVLRRGFLIKELGMSDKQRDDLQHALLNESTAALALDPSLFPALTERAEVYFELKQFQQAISDYDKILTLDAKDAGAYNDRALAKMEVGDNYGAIADFANAIVNKKRELQQSSSYEGRADAYMETQQWDLAIRDLTTAISLQTGGVVLLINIKQFRALYPEYKAASDETVAQAQPDVLSQHEVRGFLKKFSSRQRAVEFHGHSRPICEAL